MTVCRKRGASGQEKNTIHQIFTLSRIPIPIPFRNDFKLVSFTNTYTFPPPRPPFCVAACVMVLAKHQSAAEKRGLWEGVVQEPLRRAVFCVFLGSEVIFSCKSHRNFFQKLPLQCRQFLENPLAKNPKTQLLKLIQSKGRGKLPIIIDQKHGHLPICNAFECIIEIYRCRYRFIPEFHVMHCVSRNYTWKPHLFCVVEGLAVIYKSCRAAGELSLVLNSCNEAPAIT